MPQEASIDSMWHASAGILVMAATLDPSFEPKDAVSGHFCYMDLLRFEVLRSLADLVFPALVVSLTLGKVKLVDMQ